MASLTEFASRRQKVSQGVETRDSLAARSGPNDMSMSTFAREQPSSNATRSQRPVIRHGARKAADGRCSPRQMRTQAFAKTLANTDVGPAELRRVAACVRPTQQTAFTQRSFGAVKHILATRQQGKESWAIVYSDPVFRVRVALDTYRGRRAVSLPTCYPSCSADVFDVPEMREEVRLNRRSL